MPQNYERIESVLTKKSVAISLKIATITTVILSTVFIIARIHSNTDSIHQKLVVDKNLIIQAIKIGDNFFLRKYISSLIDTDLVSSAKIVNNESGQSVISIAEEQSLKNKSFISRLPSLSILKKTHIFDKDKKRWSIYYSVKIPISIILLPFLVAMLIGISIYFFMKNQLSTVAHFFTNPLESLYEDLLYFKNKNIITGFKANNYSLTPKFQELDVVVTELQSLIQKTNDQQMELQKSEIMKAEVKLSRQVAHDIRSPLSALNVISNHLEGPTKSLLQKAIRRIEGIAGDLSKANPQEIKAKDDCTFSVNIPLLIDSVISEKRFEYRTHDKINISHDYKNYALFSLVDPSQLKRCISNIINNSYEALDTFGDVKIITRLHENYVKVSITDNGKGIPIEKVNTIFDYGTTYGKTTGSGLGLAHAKNCIESWGGKICVESKLNSGTTISIELPNLQHPDWFCSELILADFNDLIIFDDDQSVHEAWEYRLSEINNSKVLHHCYSRESFLKIDCDIINSALILIDYDLGRKSRNGIELIEAYKLKNAILVTSHFEERDIIDLCLKNSIRLLPKPLISSFNIT